MRLIDADKLNRKDVNCANVPMNFIDTAPTVEAIPKSEYENRLKADLKAILVELQLEIEESKNCGKAFHLGLQMASKIIQQKINALKENDHND